MIYLKEINESVVKNIPKNDQEKKAVLDVGCGSGALAEAIRNKGYEVWGIEANLKASLTVDKRFNRIICAHLTDIPTIKESINKKKFDYIIFSDVLEHLYDPFPVLKEYLQFLTDSSHLIISVPNVVIWTNRIKILFGFFNYASTGVMDRTHIRFLHLEQHKF
ncbi:MAG: class I SAM-dependent methyltransferase [Bacteroidota bacterium]|jgi:2-polyprenyl-3-methyl-5-hydroxy-6-metoxy-1,4-benzoquinol methylase